MSDEFEICAHGKQAPRTLLANLPMSEAGNGWYKCAVCAYAAGAQTSRREPGPFKVNEVVAAIRAQTELLKRSRASFPHILPSMVGQTEFPTAPYYFAEGYSVRFQFEPALDAATIQAIHETGQWINQNFVVRLCAVLEAHHVIGKQIQNRSELAGFPDVRLARRLRNTFAHGSGRCDSTDKEHRKLKGEIIDRFSLDPADCLEGWFPLPIEKVLSRLANGCEEYVLGLGNGTVAAV